MAQEQKLIGMLTDSILRTTAKRDFSCAWVVCNNSKNCRSREVGRVAPPQNFWQKHKNGRKKAFFDVMSGVQKDLQDISARIGKFEKKILNIKIVRNLMSKLARSTLTSPSRIKVKLWQIYPVATREQYCKCDSSHIPISPWASPATTGNKMEQQNSIFWLAKSAMYYTGSHWSESEEFTLAISQRQAESTWQQHLLSSSKITIGKRLE